MRLRDSCTCLGLPVRIPFELAGLRTNILPVSPRNVLLICWHTGVLLDASGSVRLPILHARNVLFLVRSCCATWHLLPRKPYSLIHAVSAARVRGVYPLATTSWNYVRIGVRFERGVLTHALLALLRVLVLHALLALLRVLVLLHKVFL